MKVATHRCSEQLPKTRCKAGNSEVPLRAHAQHGHTNTAAPSLWGRETARDITCSMTCLYSLWKQQSLCNMHKGLPTNSFPTWEETMLSQPRQQCSNLEFVKSSQNNPAKRVNQWQSKPEAIKELQIWVNQGTHSPDLDFHLVPGYGWDCWKTAQRSSLSGSLSSKQGRCMKTQGFPWLSNKPPLLLQK